MRVYWINPDPERSKTMTPDKELEARVRALSERLDRAWAKFLARKRTEDFVVLVPPAAIEANPKEEPK